MKVVICDDHSIIRNALITVVENNFPNCTVDQAQNGTELEALFEANKYDLAILDIVVPEYEPISFLYYLKIAHPDTKVLIFSMCSESIFANRFLKLGARGFLSKADDINNISIAINTINDGDVYFSKSLKNSLYSNNMTIETTTEELFSTLSDREMEVLLLLLKGKSTNDISAVINLQASTVTTYKKRLFEKLKVTNLVELYQLSASHGLI